MKKLLLYSVAIGIVIGFTQLAMAEPATVNKEEGLCFWNGITMDVKETITNNGKGVSKFTCQGQAPEFYPLPDRAYHEKGLACFSPNTGMTYDSFFRLTPSGQATLTCKFPSPPAP